ncbi:cytochrome P450 [Agrocybe pediades]|nr:cytochrome P450 [Agrocybe pediades]
MLFGLTWVDQVVFLAFCLIVFIAIKLRNRSLPYPPGPKKLPLLGNLLDLPNGLEWETYARWSKEYDSDIIHLKAVGTHIVVINSRSAAATIFEKRSSIYSSRRQSIMLRDLMGWDWLFSSMPYGEAWKERRRIFQSYFHPNNTALFRPCQLKFVREMLPRILKSPNDLLPISRHTIGAIAMSLAYGLNIKPENDPFIKLAEEAAGTISAVAVPGAFLVDMIPVLKYVPEWVPGAGFKRKARAWRKIQERFRDAPYQQAMDDMASGTAKPSFASTSISNIDRSSDVIHQEKVIKDTAGIVFAGAADTTLTSIHNFFVAMLCYPEVQKKAQQELDQVLKGRLPEFNDEPDLPYLGALVKEVIRWKPVTPIAIPRYATADDVYNGYYIPKGSIVIGNAWAMLYDEKHYPEPHTFNPERFLKNGELNPDVLDPAEVAFGFGRRICPGRHLALSVLWLTAATILSTFNITKEKEEDGTTKEPSIEYLSGLIYRPRPFRCTIAPRCKAAEELILSGTEGL